MTALDIIPEIKITPPDGELLYHSPYTGEMTNIDTRVDVQCAPGFSKVDWDGVHDSSSGVVYDGSYPPTYNVRGGLLYARDVLTNYIANPPDTSTEPSDLKNTKANIRKIKPDVNSKLKRV